MGETLPYTYTLQCYSLWSLRRLLLDAGKHHYLVPLEESRLHCNVNNTSIAISSVISQPSSQVKPLSETNTQLKEAAHLCIELSDETVWYYEDDTYHLYVCAPCVLFILYTFGALNSIMAVCVYVL